MEFAPNSAYECLFTTANPATSEKADADALPAASAYRNGSDAPDAGFSLAVTRLSTGLYRAAGTVPAGYASGDRVRVVADAAVGGRSGNAVVDRFRVRARNVDALSTFDPSADLLDANGAGASWTWKEALRLVFAFLVGERSGGGAPEKSFSVPGGSKKRVRMTTDDNGNSTAVHLLDAGDA